MPTIPTPLPEQADLPARRPLSRGSWQFLCFGLVGCLNTLIDLLALNCLLWLWPTQSTALLLLFNSLAYAFGAINSFVLNRHWTFQRSGPTDAHEVARFGLATLGGIACNDLLLGSLNSALQAAYLQATFWTNIAKLAAIGGTVLISYLSMRLWVFVHQPQEEHLFEGKKSTMTSTEGTALAHKSALCGDQTLLPRLWQKCALVAITLISIFMHFYKLGQNGFGNLFYAAGVRSMADNLHNFFFVSYDPGGFVTVDKPPLGFWLQAISVKIFGFTPFSIFLPQALAGVLAVLILFLLVRRHFGVAAGLLAALALALSPLSVATDRNNTIDSTLTLVLLLGAWAVMYAAETGKLRWLLLSAALVGLGFNTKMAEAYLVVPAFGLLYLLASPRTLWARLGQLALALLLMLAISLSWATTVDLIPASQRPYVGSSQNNSEIGLAFGYNGIDRILGNFGFRGNRNNGSQTRQRPTTNAAPDNGTALATDNAAQEAMRDFGRGGVGAPGPLRLLNEPLAGQIAWLLPIALLGMLALAWQRRPRFQEDRQQQSLLLWGMWLLTMASFFSVSSFFHQYYMVTFAPAISALFGIGLVVMWRDYQGTSWRGWLLPLALLATACEQIHIISSNPGWGTWLIPLIAIPCLLAALALGAARLLSHFTFSTDTRMPALALSIVALLLTPAIWSAMPAFQNSASAGHAPIAGPARPYDFGDRLENTNNAALIRYLTAHQGNAKFLVATPSSMSADPIILATNQPVMALGGFSGRDPILTTNRLATLVANGTVRYFLLNNPAFVPPFLGRNFPSGTQARALGFFGFGQSSLSSLTSWVTQHCTTVSPGEWQTSTSSATKSAVSNSMLLYDCAGTP